MMKRYSAFVWATLLLAALIAVLAGWSLKNVRATAYNSLRSQGEALAEAIERSALHGFRTEHLLGQQFLETFQNQVQQLDQQLGRAKDRDTQENLLQESVRGVTLKDEPESSANIDARPAIKKITVNKTSFRIFPP